MERSLLLSLGLVIFLAAAFQIDAVAEVRSSVPMHRILILTTRGDDANRATAIEAGATTT